MARKGKTKTVERDYVLAGVAYEGRPEHNAGLVEGQPVTLVREPDNPHDDLALNVLDAGGHSLGYVPSHEAMDISPEIDDGTLAVVDARVAEVGEPEHWTGGGPTVRISVSFEERPAPAVPDAPPAPAAGWAMADDAGGTLFAITATGEAWTRGYNRHGTCGTGDTLERAGRLFPGPEGPWTRIASGGMGEALGLRPDGTLWQWGYNRSRHLGADARRPAQLRPIPSPACGLWRCFALSTEASLRMAGIKEDGTLWGWGYTTGNDGPGGAPSMSFDGEPRQIDPRDGWRSVAAGNGFFMAIRDDGTLWSWGKNQQGGLGLGRMKRTEVVTRVGEAAGWVKVAAGYDFCIGLRDDGSLWSWGDTQWWQLGLELGLGRDRYDDSEGENNHSRRTPTRIETCNTAFADVAVGGQFAIAIDTEGTLWTWGHSPTDVHWRTYERVFSPDRVPGGEKWRSVHPGCYAIRDDGSLWRVPLHLFEDCVPERVL